METSVNQEKSAKKTTIYDLAELAGTSASAVSAVLNGTWKKRRISAKLAERITTLAVCKSAQSMKHVCHGMVCCQGGFEWSQA
ncbi:hypothetical protein ASG25_09495 [Rhizobium sp. Leaf384]|nr:hypothetical protein ASG25_09495 [Rhizobium sp. Leaf384]